MWHQAILAVQVALAWFFVLSVCAALLLLAGRPLVLRWLSTAQGAGGPLLVRLLPAMVSVGLTIAVVLPAFAWLEPPGRAAQGEHPGATALSLAIAGAALLLVALARGTRAVLLTRSRMRALHGDALPATGVVSAAPVYVSESPVPSVVLDGLVTPRLFVSRSVVERLTGEELERAVAHELAHHRAHDNIKRRLLAFAPDLLTGTPLARKLEQAWKHGAELQADAAASGNQMQALALASALIKVARLSQRQPHPDLGRAAFHDGAPVADRVRALCTRTTASAPARRHAMTFVARAAATGVIVGAALSVLSLLPVVHRMTEFLVHLP